MFNSVIYKSIFENVDVGMAIADTSGQFIKVNKKLCDLLEYTKEELQNKTFQEITFPDDLENNLKHIQEIQNGIRDSFTIENRYINRTGRLIWIDLIVTAIRGDDKDIKYYIGIIKNIDELKKTQVYIETQKNLIEELLDQQPNMVLLLDTSKALFMNKVMLAYFQCDTLELFRQRYSCVCNTFVPNEHYFHTGKIKESKNWIDTLLELPKREQIVMIESLQDHKCRSFQISIGEFNDKYIINFTDISERMLQQHFLEDKAIHDTLTQAYNREYLEQNIQNLISPSIQLAFTIIDIDDFKKINDTYGHDVGDKVLKELVGVINDFSRKEDVLVRWGGEEFLLLLKIEDKVILQKVLEHLRRSIELHKFSVVNKVTCSFGATFHDSCNTWEQTFKLADIALYDAKTSGKNQIVIK
ncbi:GGDEF domain-containing protein [Sulfurimonas marina]|uniref:diguanylate cyclase n=1 Tax=Sulfurimonas marina TaxID=2590551 RepID=A0A7M3V9D4_9BACT|nr:sensor domain-containing diguanylate cyclase [Sulfurimonas marina]QOP40367.1 diguanylate cyclase [Sulfurimonas marina]